MWKDMHTRAGGGLAPMLTRFYGLGAALLLGLFTLTAQAQGEQYPPMAPSNLAVAEVTLETISSYNFSNMSEAWWKDLARELKSALSNESRMEEAMQEVIFLATYYPEKVNFDGSTGALYDIYRFDSREAYRILALVALYANGDNDAMRLLAWHGPFTNYAPWEESELVRHLTQAAVAQYYGVPQIIVEPPAVIQSWQQEQ